MLKPSLLFHLDLWIKGETKPNLPNYLNNMLNKGDFIYWLMFTLIKKELIV